MFYYRVSGENNDELVEILKTTDSRSTNDSIFEAFKRVDRGEFVQPEIR